MSSLLITEHGPNPNQFNAISMICNEFLAIVHRLVAEECPLSEQIEYSIVNRLHKLRHLQSLILLNTLAHPPSRVLAYF